MRREASSSLGASSILRRFGLRPRKDLGQHFLTEERVSNRIVATAELTGADTVIEVGAGLGALTRPLARAAGQVVAVELDRDLASVLSQLLVGEHNVTLVQGDILQFSSAELLIKAGLVPATPYIVVGNLPYMAASAILRHFLEMDLHPLHLVVTVQQEVAERITARPGEMSLLSVGVQFYGRPKIVLRLKPGAFYPRPEVSSAVVRIDCYDESPLSVEDPRLFFRVARAGFTQRRKQIHNSLAAGLSLPGDMVRDVLRRAEIDPRRRAQTLSLGEWDALCCFLSPLISPT